MPLYLLRLLSVTTTLRGQSTCREAGSARALGTDPAAPARQALLTWYLSSRQLSTSGALGAKASGRNLRAKERLAASGLSPCRLCCRALLSAELSTSGVRSSPGVCPAPSWKGEAQASARGPRARPGRRTPHGPPPAATFSNSRSLRDWANSPS